MLQIRTYFKYYKSIKNRSILYAVEINCKSKYISVNGFKIYKSINYYQVFICMQIRVLKGQKLLFSKKVLLGLPLHFQNDFQTIIIAVEQ